MTNVLIYYRTRGFANGLTQMPRAMKRIIVSLTALALAGLCETAHADVFILTFPEINGTIHTSGFPLPLVDWSTRAYSIPAGQTIVDASISGTWGSTSQFYGNTAEAQLFVNGLLVSDTATLSPDPANNVVPFTFNYTTAELATLTGSSATLSYIQTSQSIVRLSGTTLTIETTPEPGTMVLAGLGGLSILLLRRHKRAC